MSTPLNLPARASKNADGTYDLTRVTGGIPVTIAANVAGSDIPEASIELPAGTPTGFALLGSTDTRAVIGYQGTPVAVIDLRAVGISRLCTLFEFVARGVEAVEADLDDREVAQNPHLRGRTLYSTRVARGGVFPAVVNPDTAMVQDMLDR